MVSEISLSKNLNELSLVFANEPNSQKLPTYNMNSLFKNSMNKVEHYFLGVIKV